MQYLIAPYNHRIRTLVYQCCDAAALEDDETPDAGAADADYSPAQSTRKTTARKARTKASVQASKQAKSTAMRRTAAEDEDGKKEEEEEEWEALNRACLPVRLAELASPPYLSKTPH